jgi:hypothetical protein
MHAGACTHERVHSWLHSLLPMSRARGAAAPFASQQRRERACRLRGRGQQREDARERRRATQRRSRGGRGPFPRGLSFLLPTPAGGALDGLAPSRVPARHVRCALHDRLEDRCTHVCALDPGTADCASPTLSCVADRVVASTARAATMGWYSWSLDPSNEYLKYHATPAWEALRTLQACL